MDLYAAIVSGGFRNTADDQFAWKRLVAHLKETAPSLYNYAFKNRAKLQTLIDDVWSWEQVEDALSAQSLTRLGRVQRSAAGPCTCGGHWCSHAVGVLRNNGVDPQQVFGQVRSSLAQGRGPATKVLVLAGQYGGEGKYFLLAPLRTIFGTDLQETPQPGNFPLLGLENKSVVLLDEWRFDERVLRMSTQLLWFEGKPFPLTRPQNQAGVVGHSVYTGTAPIFITTKAEALVGIRRAAELAQQANEPSQNTMLLRRLNIVNLSVPTPVRQGLVISECASCFSRMVLEGAADHVAIAGEIDPRDI